MSDAPTPLGVERITVEESRVDIVVGVDAGFEIRTSAYPEAVASILELLPGLSRHRCECGSAHGIERELADTELPHLLEHVVLELMVLAGSPRTLAGCTTWDFKRDGKGVFHVRIEYDDDLVALGAVREGIEFVNTAVEGEDLPDISSVLEELKRFRGVPTD